jgi:hypothetical protein
MHARKPHHLDDQRKRYAPCHYNHTEIDVRYAWLTRQGRDCRKYPRGSPPLICRVRLRELEAIFAARYGAFLPYDDAGIDDLYIAARHIAHLGAGAYAHIIAWAREWMPQMPTAEAEALAKRALADPRRPWKAGTLGWRLRLTREERAALNITTIRAFDMSEAEMIADRKRKRREARDRWRQRQSMPPKPEPLCRTRPWEKLGMSQATWYRKGKPMPEAAAESGEKTPGMQQVLAAPRCTPSNFSPVARPEAVRPRTNPSSPSSKTVSIQEGAPGNEAACNQRHVAALHLRSVGLGAHFLRTGHLIGVGAEAFEHAHRGLRAFFAAASWFLLNIHTENITEPGSTLCHL